MPIAPGTVTVAAGPLLRGASRRPERALRGAAMNVFVSARGSDLIAGSGRCPAAESAVHMRH